MKIGCCITCDILGSFIPLLTASIKNVFNFVLPSSSQFVWARLHTNVDHFEHQDPPPAIPRVAESDSKHFQGLGAASKHVCPQSKKNPPITLKSTSSSCSQNWPTHQAERAGRTYIRAQTFGNEPTSTT